MTGEQLIESFGIIQNNIALKHQPAKEDLLASFGIIQNNIALKQNNLTIKPKSGFWNHSK